MTVPHSIENRGECTAILGAQWGNEGKGKLVAHLCETADVCARFNGGANNIHTLSIDHKGEVYIGRDSELPSPSSRMKHTLVLRLFPLGVINKNCQIVFGNGMVLHLPTLLEEIRAIEAAFDPNVRSRIFISTRAHVVFDFHLEMDGVFDKLRGVNQLGTTQKGIGPAYSTKTIRNGIRVGDFVSESAVVREKLVDLTQYFQKYESGLTVDVDKVLTETLTVFQELRPRVTDTVSLMNEFSLAKKSIVCEGANSVMSDIDFGTYPYVTSSNTTPGAASVGLGIPPTRLTNIIGVCKAYTSRAQHWFPSSLGASDTAISDHLVARGRETGTSSNKARRVGWLDLVQVKYACEMSGFDELMLTKLDALSGLEQIGIVTKYKNFNVDKTGYPSTIEEFSRIQPEVEYVPGWSSSLASVSSIANLPENAKLFIRKIESYLHVPITRVQLGCSETNLSANDIITL